MNDFHASIGARVIDAASVLLRKGHLSRDQETATRAQLRAQIEVRGIPGTFDMELLVAMFPPGHLQPGTSVVNLDKILQLNLNSPDFLLTLGERISDAMGNIRQSGSQVAAVMEVECERMDGGKEQYRITVERQRPGEPLLPPCFAGPDDDEDDEEKDDDLGLLRRL